MKLEIPLMFPGLTFHIISCNNVSMSNKVERLAGTVLFYFF